ncbi:hypothetical protein K435DRAFT_782159 [Dendrothele bispora CBS 962.96]|uniref:Uncharacterized protein n=1 Tax=Dendrothele bispora (strain CBS 962.96) TaxID=1314807 RepID=A0A4S8LGF6_DENBC|nr:hypothetical protein K435DRAFT_782159 [Dendrothele bispora CBS 962.96]
MSFTTSTTLTQLINFLTRPLILTRPAITVAHLQQNPAFSSWTSPVNKLLLLLLQLVLQANLSSFLPFTPAVDASLADNKDAKLVPIPPIYAGCLPPGIPWDNWTRVLTAGLGSDVYVFFMEGCIRVGVPKMDIKEGEQGLDLIELWREPEEKSEHSPMVLKLRATLSSVHARKTAAQASVPSTTSTTTTTTRARSSSPDSTVESPSSSTSSDVDYDSDSESTTSSSYSAVSKFSSRSSESMTSVSTTCSDVASDDNDDKNKNENNDRVFYRHPGDVTTTVVATAPVVSRQRAPCPTTSKTTFAPRNKAESHKPQSTPTLRNLAPKSRYMYEGGEMGVVTGGVMLGSPSHSSPATTTTTTTTPRSSSSGSSKGTKEGSWRASSGSLSKGTKKNASVTASENWRRRV